MAIHAVRLTALFALIATVPLSAQYKYLFQDPSLDREVRITNIILLMPLEEKIAALGTNTAVPRLGIPDAGGSEGLHGLVQRSLGVLGAQKPVPTTRFCHRVDNDRSNWTRSASAGNR